MTTMRYSRTLSPTFEGYLDSGVLAWLLKDAPSRYPSDPFVFDMQLRKDDVLTCYHGTTKLLDVRYKPKVDRLELSAAPSYGRANGYTELMRDWSADRLAGNQRIVSEYLVSSVNVARKHYYQNHKEGFWQNRLSIAFGKDWRPEMDWLIIDREAEIQFADAFQRDKIFKPIQDEFIEIRDDFQKNDPKRFGRPDRKPFGNQCDFLAIRPGGELLCIELKHGSDTTRSYWAGLQVAVYGKMFAEALPEISESIKALVRQKVKLGLLPDAAINWLPAEGFHAVTPVLAVAEPEERSVCWGRLNEVMKRCPGPTVSVVEFRNYQDPIPVPRD